MQQLGGGGDAPLSEKARRWWVLAIMLAVSVAVGIAAYLAYWPAHYLLYGIICGFACWQAARKYVALSGVPSQLHSGALFLLASTPMWAWGIGAMYAYQILNGTQFSRVVLPHSVVLRAGIDDDDELRLLGRTDAYVLLWMPNRSRVLIIADSAVDALQIESHSARTWIEPKARQSNASPPSRPK